MENVEDMCRKSKDKTIRNGEYKLIRLIEEIGGYIMNGTVKGDKEGEFTYIGARGCIVIDYNRVNEYCNNKVKGFRIENRIESDYLPTALILREEGEEDEVGGRSQRGETREEDRMEDSYKLE